MILAMQNNAKITDPQKMEQALASVALLGQQGSFEAADMAKWFPELLAQMASTGITGQEAVTQLGRCCRCRSRAPAVRMRRRTT